MEKIISGEDLKKQNELLASIIQLSDDAILSKNLDGIILSWNRGAEKLFGYTSDEIIGKSILILIPEHLQKEEKEIIEKIKNRELIDHFETKRICKNGQEVDVSITVSPVENSLGQIVGASKIIRNITFQKEAENSLKKSVRLYAFISGINQSIVHITEKPVLLRKACRIAIDIGLYKLAWVGFVEDGSLTIAEKCGDLNLFKDLTDLRGKNLTVKNLNNNIGKALATGEYVVDNDLSHHPDTNLRALLVKYGIKAGITFPLKKFGIVTGVFVFLSEDLNPFDTVEIALLNEAVNDIAFALENFEKADIHRQMELRMEHTLLRLQEAEQTAEMGSWEIDLTTDTYNWSDGFFKIYGLDKSNVIPSKELFLSLVHPEDLTTINTVMAQLYTSDTDLSCEYRFIRSDGSVRNATAILRLKSDNHNNPQRLFGIIRDVTSKKHEEAEREKMLKEIVLRNQNLEQFTYIVSHNLRLPVANIEGFADILRDRELSQTKRAQFMELLFTSVRKLVHVIADLHSILNIHRKLSEKFEVVSFSKMVEDVIFSIHHLVKKEDAKIITDFSDVNTIKTIESYLHSVFFNLISNSLKYRRKDIPLIIEIKSRIENGKIILLFKDNGMGIDLNKNKQKVFVLYSRFHSNIEGKGMGLFMVKTHIESLGGTISIQSSLNKGTVFTIEFENN